MRVAHLRTLTLQEAPDRPRHVSAASGLVRAGEHLYVVPDDEHHLAVFPAAGHSPGRLMRLIEGELPSDHAERKRRKPDFESLLRLPSWPGTDLGALLALGSCSKPHRCNGVLLPLGSDGPGTPSMVDMSSLRDGLERRFGGRLNLEGAFVAGDEMQLLQRGNKGDRRNARIRLRLETALAALASGSLDASGLIGIDEVPLGEVDGVALCFSDGAALADGRVVFTAVAEDTWDSYNDGACRGAAIGILDARGRLQRLERIEGLHKAEGIEATLRDGTIHALLVTDADDPAIPAALLACELAA